MLTTVGIVAGLAGAFGAEPADRVAAVRRAADRHDDDGWRGGDDHDRRGRGLLDARLARVASRSERGVAGGLKSLGLGPSSLVCP